MRLLVLFTIAISTAEAGIPIQAEETISRASYELVLNENAMLEERIRNLETELDQQKQKDNLQEIGILEYQLFLRRLVIAIDQLVTQTDIKVIRDSLENIKSAILKPLEQRQ